MRKQSQRSSALLVVLFSTLAVAISGCNPLFKGAVDAPSVLSLSQSTLSVSSSQVEVSGAVTVTVRLKDAYDRAYNKTPAPNISLSHSGGTSVGTLDAVTNNHDGTYSATFTGVSAGTATTIHATVNGSELLSALPTITVTSPSTYTVIYNGNTNTGGSAPVDASSPYNYNSTVTVLGNTGTLTKTGYTFSGWNTAANGSGTAYAAAATFSISANTTLYAQWTINTYTVTYNGNTNTGGSAPVDGSSPYNYNSSVTVLGNTGVKPNFITKSSAYHLV